MPTALGSHPGSLGEQPPTLRVQRKGGEENATGSCYLLTPSTHFVTVTPCLTAGGALSPGEALWCQAVLSPGSGPQKLWDHLCAVCPQAHAPRQGWPSLAGLSGFGCSHTCSDPAPGCAGCVAVGGVGGRRDGILHCSPHPSMSPEPAGPPGSPSGVPSWGMLRPGWCSVTEVVLVTL